MAARRDRGHSVLRYRLGNDMRSRRLHRTWYRGPTCNFTPSMINLGEPDAVADYIVKGWAPEQPIIAPDASILAVGSCFAQYVVQHLRKTRRRLKVNNGMNVNVIACGAGFVSTFTLRQQFEWALGLREIESATLYIEDGENEHGLPGLKLLPTDAATRERTRQTITAADMFILTLGLSEIWYDKKSGDAFFGAVPSVAFNPSKHAFRVTSVEENRDNLTALCSAIRNHRPNAPIVLTLSPVPLTATFRPVSCLTANCVSKSILRVAVDEMVRESDDPLLFYWPSYEIVTDFFGARDAYHEDRRHVKPEVVATIMDLFERFFVKQEEI